MANPRMRPSSSSAISPAEFHILLALAESDLHGYAIMQRVSADTDGDIQLGPGTLYTAVKRLLEASLIREVESRVDPELDDARRRYYRLTAGGRAAAAAEARR